MHNSFFSTCGKYMAGHLLLCLNVVTTIGSGLDLSEFVMYALSTSSWTSSSSSLTMKLFEYKAENHIKVEFTSPS